MTTIDKIMSLADDYATAFGVFSETRIERRETLRTEIEKLVRDAERYQWLKDNCALGIKQNGTGWSLNTRQCVAPEGMHDLDAAIDAAMEKQP